MRTLYTSLDQMCRVGTGQRWRIPHAATHLSITILLPDTDPPAVRWVLPNGQQIEGNVIDADVPAGETLCICDDFSRCGIDMDGCAPGEVYLNCRAMPIIRPRLQNLPGRCGMWRDMRISCPDSVITSSSVADKLREMGSGCYRFIGTSMVFDIGDVNRRLLPTRRYTTLEISSAPNFTGNLYDLDVFGVYFHCLPDADFKTTLVTDGRSNKIVTLSRFMCHHTSVYGHPKADFYTVGRYSFYANPNMTSNDYDQVCIDLCSFFYTADGSKIDFSCLISTSPDDFVFEISSRRTSASDEAIAKLRDEVGMTVIEIEEG